MFILILEIIVNVFILFYSSYQCLVTKNVLAISQALKMQGSLFVSAYSRRPLETLQTSLAAATVDLPSLVALKARGILEVHFKRQSCYIKLPL